MERALRVLLHKARTGELVGLAFVGVKRTGICAGTVNLCEHQEQALEVGGRLVDAILGKEAFIERVDGE